VKLETENYRMVSWWITWQDLDWPSPDNLDRIRLRADQMAAANVNVATVFGAHFRWDFLPIWDVLHDYLATVAEELHQRGILFFDHHSAVLVHRYDNREEMRNVKLHSGPHLPFSPNRRAAASWEFNGSRLNDWRMKDALTGEILYLPQYTAEQFCYNNPTFREAYLEYVKLLLAETGIDGLMCDDAIHFMGYRSCACDCCKAQFRAAVGFDLPAPHDRNFWGNWNNPAWPEYIDMRFRNNGDFLKQVQSVLPENFPLMSCCSGSNRAIHNNTGQDVRQFNRACDLVHLEMCGNTPPWYGEGHGWSHTMGERLTQASQHLAAAQQRGYACLGQGYGFSEPSADIIWAFNKSVGASCWFSTLKGRLGLPESVLATLPDDASPAGKVFRFEKDHPELFAGGPIFELGVYFSYETRNHTGYGNLNNGFSRDFSDTLNLFLANGLSAGTVLKIPEDTNDFSILVLPSVARLTEEEQARLRQFTGDGGKVFATGPFGFEGLEQNWELPMQSSGEIWEKSWMEEPVAPVKDKPEWREIETGVFSHPSRIQDAESGEFLLEKVAPESQGLPFRIRKSKGFFTVSHWNEQSQAYVVHLLAADYDTDVDHRLESRRYHRSRVDLIVKASPVGTDGIIEVETDYELKAFSPLTPGNTPQVKRTSGGMTVSLPENCSYAIIELTQER
jgi:hypothetical protein